MTGARANSLQEFGPISFKEIGSLAALAALWPGVARAEVCDKARPGWDGTPATVWTEAFALLATAPALALILLTALAFRFRKPWMTMGVVLLWTGFVTLITMLDPTGLRAPMMAEGCAAPPTVFIALVGLACIALVMLSTRPITEAGD